MIYERSPELAALHAEVFGTSPQAGAKLPAFVNPADAALDAAFEAGQLPATVAHLSDDDLIARAQAASNGAKFSSLWSGDWSAYGSQSEADAALAFLLSFWTQGDPVRMDRLFRASGLFRQKWDARRGSKTYGQRTIDGAISRNPEHYAPSSVIPALPLEADAPAREIDLDTPLLEAL